MNLKKLLFMLTFFVLLGTTAFAQTYVSATNGDDTFGTGTQAQPYRSISKAVAVLNGTGGTISVEAGVYSTALTGETAGPLTINDAGETYTFVGTAVGVNTTVSVAAGFTLTDGIVNMGLTGDAAFNFGAGTMTLTAGTMNIATANVILASGATLSIADGTLNTVPTTGANLNVTFNGTNAISSTSAFLPSSIGTGLLTINKASGAITIDNATLAVNGITINNVATVTVNSNITTTADITVSAAATVNLNGNVTLGSATAGAAVDITNTTGTVTVGASSANTLTVYTTAAAASQGTDANVGEISNTGAGSITINSTVAENIANTGTTASGADSDALVISLPIFNATSGDITVNGNVTLNNTNIKGTSATVNDVSHSVIFNNSGTGTVAFNGTVSTPNSTAGFTTPGNAQINVILDNGSTGTMSTRTAELGGATGTNGVINDGGGIMVLGQSGDTFSSSYDVLNSGATASLTVNATATFGGAFTTVNAASLVTLNANASVAGLVTHAGKMKLNANTLTLTGDLAPHLAGAGDIYSVTTATTGSGWVKVTGDAVTFTYTGNLPNVEYAGTTSLATAGNGVFGEFKTAGDNGAITIGASDIRGNLNLASGGAAVTIGGATTVRGNVEMTSGDITLGANLTVNGTFNMPQGTFAFGANTLNLVGNFNRTGGTIDAAAAGTGTLNFAGTTNQTFTPGTQMNVFNVTVNNTGSYLVNVIDDNNVTITASLIVLRNFTITTGRVVLGTSNIRMQQANLGAPVKSARFTNGGRGYTASGIGGIIFEGDGTNAVGGGDGAVITGANPFSNIYVRLTTAANNVYAIGAVSISGVVTLDAGGIIWNAADDVDIFTTSTLTLDDALVVPTVVINTQNTHGSPYLVDGADGGAVALAITSVYNLTYSGQTARTITGNEFITTKVNNLTLQAGTAGKTITGVVGTIVGNLFIAKGDILDQTAGALTASGNTAVHTVNGSLTVGTLAVTGNAATLQATDATGAASVAILTVTNAAGTFTSTGMKVLGTVTINGAGLTSNITMDAATATLNTFTNTAGTTTLNMNSTAVTATGNYTVTAGSVNLTMNDAAAGTATIGGTLAVNGGTLTLGSSVWVTGAVTHDGTSVIALGDYNLTLADDYTHNNTATFTAGTGALVAKATPLAANTFTFTTTVTIPNFTLNYGAFGIDIATAGFTVSNKFVHTAGDLDLNALPLTISGNTYTYTAGTYTNTTNLATGVVNLTGAALNITASGNPSYEYVNVNSTGTVTFKSNNTTARTFTVSKTFTHTKGNIVLEINDINLTDNGAANANYTTAATAGTVTGTATGANLGEVVFSGNFAGVQNLTLADNYSIQNLRVANTAHTSVTKTDTKVLTIGSNISLDDNFTVTASARLVLADGVTITRTSGVFDVVPTFGTTVNVNYTPAGALNSDLEIPAAANVLNNLTITSGAPVLTANTTVNGTLFLVGGTISTGTKTLTIAEGATIDRSGGDFAGAATDVPTVTTYKLVYSGAGAITIGKEFVSSTTAVTSLTVSMTGAGVLLNADRTVGSFSMSPTGAGAANVYFSVGTDAATKTFTVTGPTTIDNGIVSTQDATAATSTDASSFVAKGSVTVNGGSFGTLGTDNGAGYDGGLNLTFGGAVAQSLTLNGNITIPNITLNSTGTAAADVVVNVTGGNLTITNLITFQNGILNMGSNTLYLPRPTGAANGGLAFDRTAVGVGEFGHVVGKVSRPANSGDGASGTNGRFEFPVGTLTGEYRPAAINFTPNYVVNNPVSIEVNHIDTTPGGTVGLPIDGGNGVKIGNYTNFYWLVNTTPSSLSSTQNFDIDLQANNIGLPYTSDAQLRIIRRQDGAAETNAWSMQGTAANYANYQVVTGTDTVVVARTTSSQGGLVYQGSRFSIGVPTRAPSFTAPAVLAYTVNENTSTPITVTATGNDVGETVTVAKVSGPDWATYADGVLTLAPGYDAGSATAYTIVLRATDSSGMTADLTVTVTVNNVNRAPSFTADGAVALTDKTVKAGSVLAGGVTAVDDDGGDLTYTIAIDPALAGTISITAAATGAYEFAPVFADAGKDFNVTITVTDNGGLTATTTAKFTVDYPVALGDVDGNGSVGAADASEILKYVVGLVTFDAQQMYAANVNGDAEVGALDAAWVLYYVANGTWPSGAKMNAVAGLVDFGQIASENGVINMPINLTATSGVLSAYTEISINDQVEVTGVTARLPEGWTMVQNVANNKVRIAMAGLTPLTEGTYAVVGLKLKDKEAVVNISGLANLNDQLNASLSAKVREIPSEYALSQNYPNPFNPTTTIKFAVAEKAPVTLNIYNMLGQKVKSLVDSEQEAGFYTVNWDGTNDFGSRVASGIYIYRITAGKFTSTMKMNLLK